MVLTEEKLREHLDGITQEMFEREGCSSVGISRLDVLGYNGPLEGGESLQDHCYSVRFTGEIPPDLPTRLHGARVLYQADQPRPRASPGYKRA